MHPRRISILDTTLRDGSQAPGYFFSLDDKIRLVDYLERIGVDIIEVGFPASSSMQFNDIRTIAGMAKNSAVAVMARSLPADIKTAAGAIRSSRKGLIHLSIATSPLHREYKLKMDRSQVMKKAVEAVHFAKGYCSLVEIGAEDATRTEPEFLAEFCNAVADAGADIINIADTVGFCQPEEFYFIIKDLIHNVPAILSEKTHLSIHCHNDLGLAAANTLAGLSAGAMQAECTLFGIGERSGNTALEEVVISLDVRKDYFKNISTGIHPELFVEGRKLLEQITGIPLPASKPIIGRNSFVHSSGIHQHGMTVKTQTYELFTPEKIGECTRRFQLNSQSGSAGVRQVIQERFGLNISELQLAEVLLDVKAAHFPVSSTALIIMLNKKKIIISEIWAVSDFSSVRKETDRITLSFSIKSTFGKLINISSEEENPYAFITDRINEVFFLDIAISEMVFSKAGLDPAMTGHFFLKSICKGETFFSERKGADDIRLFIESLLDIINEHEIKRGDDEYEEKRLLDQASDD